MEYETGQDYRGVVLDPAIDGPMLDLRRAGEVLGVGAEQVRRDVVAGRLPASRGPNGKGSYRLPANMVEAYAATRARGIEAGLTALVLDLQQRVTRLEANSGVGPLDARDTAAPDLESLLTEVADLRARNVILQESEERLALAAEAEHEAADALSDALSMTRAAANRQTDAERARAKAGEEYSAALRAYRLPGHIGEGH